MAQLVRQIGNVPGLGSVSVVASERGLVALSVDAWVAQPPVSHRRIEIVGGSNPIIDATCQQLQGFILGRQREFYIACDFSGLSDTRRVVLDRVRKIPWGETQTYTQIAIALSLGPQSVRSIVETLCRNPIPLVIPCHRVVDTIDVGHFVAGPAVKRQLLAMEGVDTSRLRDPTDEPPTSTWIRRTAGPT